MPIRAIRSYFGVAALGLGLALLHAAPAPAADALKAISPDEGPAAAGLEERLRGPAAARQHFIQTLDPVVVGDRLAMTVIPNHEARGSRIVIAEPAGPDSQSPMIRIVDVVAGTATSLPLPRNSGRDFSPKALAYADPFVYLIETNGRLWRGNLVTQRWRSPWTLRYAVPDSAMESGFRPAVVRHPGGIAVDAARGMVYVTEASAGRLIGFRLKNGAFRKGALIGNLTAPEDIVPGPHPTVPDRTALYVADRLKNTVHAHDPDTFEALPFAVTVTNPARLAIDPNHRLLFVVSDHEGFLGTFRLDTGAVAQLRFSAEDERYYARHAPEIDVDFEQAADVVYDPRANSIILATHRRLIPFWVTTQGLSLTPPPATPAAGAGLEERRLDFVKGVPLTTPMIQQLKAGDYVGWQELDGPVYYRVTGWQRALPSPSSVSLQAVTSDGSTIRFSSIDLTAEAFLAKHPSYVTSADPASPRLSRVAAMRTLSGDNEYEFQELTLDRDSPAATALHQRLPFSNDGPVIAIRAIRGNDPIGETIFAITDGRTAVYRGDLVFELPSEMAAAAPARRVIPATLALWNFYEAARGGPALPIAPIGASGVGAYAWTIRLEPIRREPPLAVALAAAPAAAGPSTSLGTGLEEPAVVPQQRQAVAVDALEALHRVVRDAGVAPDSAHGYLMDDAVADAPAFQRLGVPFRVVVEQPEVARVLIRDLGVSVAAIIGVTSPSISEAAYLAVGVPRWQQIDSNQLADLRQRLAAGGSSIIKLVFPGSSNIRSLDVVTQSTRDERLIRLPAVSALPEDAQRLLTGAIRATEAYLQAMG